MAGSASGTITALFLGLALALINVSSFLNEENTKVGCLREFKSGKYSRRATADEVVRIVQAFVVSGEALNCLNLCDRSPATWQLVLRVRDQVGVMAALLEAIRADGINAQEISSRVFTGVKAAWCTIALDERPSTEALDSIRALPQVLHLELRAVV